MSDADRGWDSSIANPRSIRHCSLLPDEDADEAYCIRHRRWMRRVDPVVHRSGALYTTTERFSVYSCPQCIDEIGRQIADVADDGGVKVYQAALIRFFDRWDEGDAEGDWFRYLGEGSLDDARERMEAGSG